MKDLTDAVCYCINLKNRPDRRKLFTDQSALEILPPIHYIDAIAGNSLDVKNDDRIGILTRVQVLTQYRRSHYEIHSKGALGASLSHLKTWKAFLASSANYAIIFEDDAELPPTLSLMVRDCIAQSPPPWDIWLLGWNHGTHDYKATRNDTFKEVIKFVGAHCYLITRKAAKILVENALPIQTHIEHYMCNTAFLYKLKIIRHSLLHIAQIDRTRNISDVRKPEGCPVCIVDDNSEAVKAREAGEHRKN